MIYNNNNNNNNKWQMNVCVEPLSIVLIYGQ